MGLIYENLHMLLTAYKKGVSFKKTLTLGNQNLNINKKDKIRLSVQFSLNRTTVSSTITSDDFFRQWCGAAEVTAMDVSNYEGSTLMHDLNMPIPIKHHNKFDMIIDGGTLEHVFNFPIALENCMNMLKKDGTLFIFTMANNHLGHGFYQFSPELFFNVLSRPFGFCLEELILLEHRFPSVELSRKHKYYSVIEPKKLRTRVGLVSKKPVMMMVHARKIDEQSGFKNGFPIQSDYEAIYLKKESQEKEKISIVKHLFQKLPTVIKNQLRGMLELHRYSLKNRQVFKRKHW